MEDELIHAGKNRISRVSRTACRECWDEFWRKNRSHKRPFYGYSRYSPLPPHVHFPVQISTSDINSSVIIEWVGWWMGWRCRARWASPSAYGVDVLGSWKIARIFVDDCHEFAIFSDKSARIFLIFPRIWQNLHDFLNSSPSLAPMSRTPVLAIHAESWFLISCVNWKLDQHSLPKANLQPICQEQYILI